jgi:hypothetical protein
MRTVKGICKTKRLTQLQKQLIIGYCTDADIVTEEDLNKRKAHNRKIFNNCVNSLNRSNKDKDPDAKDYIHLVEDINDIKDEHDIYVVSTTFGLKFYYIKSNKPASPTMKLMVMLNARMNDMDTCFIHGGSHKNHYLGFTGCLLQYPAHKYHKVNDYETITRHYNGYKA